MTMHLGTMGATSPDILASMPLEDGQAIERALRYQTFWMALGRLHLRPGQGLRDGLVDSYAVMVDLGAVIGRIAATAPEAAPPVAGLARAAVEAARLSGLPPAAVAYPWPDAPDLAPSPHVARLESNARAEADRAGDDTAALLTALIWQAAAAAVQAGLDGAEPARLLGLVAAGIEAGLLAD